MRILMLRPYIQVGGVDTHLRLLSRELIARGHEVGIVTSRHSSAPSLREQGVSVSYAPLLPSTPASIARSVYRLRKIIVAQPVSILHSHHRFTTVVGHIVSRITRVPLVVTIHEFKQDRRWLAQSWTGAITLVPSQALASHLRDFYNVAENYLRVVPNAVDGTVEYDLNRDTLLRQQLRYSADAPWIGFVGRLSPEKGCQYLISSIPLIRREFPHARFVVAGSGPDEAMLHEHARSLDLDPDSIFVGERTEIVELMGLLDVLVIPSVEESFALVALEAMRAARPVVASAVGGIPEVVHDHVTGLLVPPKSPAALSEAICRLIAHPQERKIFGLCGRRSVVERFSPSAMAERTLEAYCDARRLVDK